VGGNAGGAPETLGLIERKGNIMKTLLAASACLAALALAGCAGHTHSGLIPEDSDPALKLGVFRHQGQEEPLMALEYRGKRFEGRGFAIQRQQNLAELRRKYGADIRHFRNIVSGADTNHFVYSAEPRLLAGDGAALRCVAAWQANGAPAGYCVTDEGTRIHFRFE
jgi:hypothetical protein